MRASLTVGDVLGGRPETIGLPLELVSGGSGLDRPIRTPHIQKTGLALAGFDEYLQPGRVLVFGESEVRYLEGLEPGVRAGALSAILTRDIPCVLVTGGLDVSPDLRLMADRHAVPLLRTAVPTPFAIARLTMLLEDGLAVKGVVHGVLMDILGLGVLIVGESGIGKSECALDLVVRGHRLVADDAVELQRRGEAVVVGTCPELTRHHMEVRGLGVMNLRDLFGIASTRRSKRVEFVVQLERWDPAPRGSGVADPSRHRDYDRLGLDEHAYELLGVQVPLVRMPVAPGRSLAILVEVAARNQILRMGGHVAARDLAARLERAMQDADPERDVDGDDDVAEGGDA